MKTKRLGLRNWLPSDLEPFYKMCQDETVMRFFPKKLSEKDTQDFINRMQTHFKEYGFCYFAVSVLETNEFIGMIGLLNQNFKSDYTPCVDIGWRLKQNSWGNGYATEGAIACIDFAFKTLKLKDVFSFATLNNKGSESIMKKIGMKYIGQFQHPKIIDNEKLRDCMVYKIENK